MATSDDFARALDSGYLPAGLAAAITGSAADAQLVHDLVRGNSGGHERAISGSLVTSLNTLMGTTRTASQWQDAFRQHRLYPV